MPKSTQRTRKYRMGTNDDHSLSEVMSWKVLSPDSGECELYSKNISMEDFKNYTDAENKFLNQKCPNVFKAKNLCKEMVDAPAYHLMFQYKNFPTVKKNCPDAFEKIGQTLSDLSEREFRNLDEEQIMFIAFHYPNIYAEHVTRLLYSATPFFGHMSDEDEKYLKYLIRIYEQVYHALYQQKDESLKTLSRNGLRDFFEKLRDNKYRHVRNYMFKAKKSVRKSKKKSVRKSKKKSVRKARK
jgi:hypothetical protein